LRAWSWPSPRPRSSRPAITEFSGVQHGIEVNLTPLAARLPGGQGIAA
jgi:hypothetical protein